MADLAFDLLKSKLVIQIWQQRKRRIESLPESCLWKGDVMHRIQQVIDQSFFNRRA